MAWRYWSEIAVGGAHRRCLDDLLWWNDLSSLSPRNPDCPDGTPAHRRKATRAHRCICATFKAKSHGAWLSRRNFCGEICQVRGRAHMANVVRSIGHGLSAAGIFLLCIYFLTAYLAGHGALYEALNPFAPKAYFAFFAMMPGGFCIWLAHYLSGRRRRSGSTKWARRS
jgi:hypothetical protein